jgi:acyl-CoA synthetase (AMP-forming)/AMP-acid ligase II
MNVAHLMVGQASKRPDARALIEGSGRQSREISFAALDTDSGRCASLLLASGVAAGDHVLVFVPMSINLYLALLAIFRIGAIATFLDPSVGRDHIRRCCQTVRPAAMIAISKAHLLRLTSSAIRKIPRKFYIGWPVPNATRWAIAPASPAPIISRMADDPALLTFTSGSTGNPKGAVRSHGFLAAQHASLGRAIDLTAGEVDLATLPIFSLANLASGVTTVIADADLRRPGFIDAAPVLRQIARHRITRSVASPALFERLLAGSDSGVLLATMRHVYTGGAPVFPGLMDRLQRAMPSARIVAVYGSTEAEPIAHIAKDEIGPEDSQAMFRGAGLLAGPPVADIDLRIIENQWGRALASLTGAQFAESILAAGQPGEIVVHGAHVLRGYLHGEGDEATKFKVDDQVWHRTGDAGFMDDRGRLWLLGRADAKIQDELGTIYPFAVECAASGIDGIHRSALIQHDRKRVLIVQPNPNPPPDLETTILKQLAWANIQSVRMLKRIPLDKRHNAKIDYPALRKMIQ